MEVDQPRLENRAMTFDEVSMERSKSFVKALQVLLFFRFFFSVKFGTRSDLFLIFDLFFRRFSVVNQCVFTGDVFLVFDYQLTLTLLKALFCC